MVFFYPLGCCSIVLRRCADADPRFQNNDVGAGDAAPPAGCCGGLCCTIVEISSPSIVMLSFIVVAESVDVSAALLFAAEVLLVFVRRLRRLPDLEL